MKISVLFTFALILMCSCSKDASNWQLAKQANDIQSYKQFIQQFPKSTFIDSANYYIDKLAFDQATEKNSLAGYLALIQEYPHNRFIQILSQAGDEVVIDSMPDEFAKNSELIIRKIPDSKFKITWNIPPHEKFNIGGMILESGPDGNSLEKEMPDSLPVSFDAQIISLEKELALYVNKNMILICDTTGSKVTRTADKKVVLTQGLLYIVNLK